MLPTAIFFDLDDTIVSFDGVAEPAWKEICSIFAEKTKLFKSEDLFNSIDEIRKWFWSDPERHRNGRLNLNQARRIIVRNALEKLKCYNEKIANEIADSYSHLREELIDFFPNAEDTLKELVNKNIKLALLANGEAKNRELKLKDLIFQSISMCV